jgi:hypothetical protein
LDLAALVVGYSLAARGIRFLLPRTPSHWVLVAVALEYLWLGLAMSGPFVLWFDRRPLRDGQAEGSPDRKRRWLRTGDQSNVPPLPPARESSPRYTGAELAWLLIGGYWVGMSVLLSPGPEGISAASVPVLGLIAFLTALVLLLAGPGQAKHAPQGPPWTHRAAVVLLSTWPIAWLLMIALTKLV